MNSQLQEKMLTKILIDWIKIEITTLTFFEWRSYIFHFCI